jgi:hypothetical protein
MKRINYTTDNQPLDGYIELKNNQQINAQNILITDLDSLIRYDEVITTSVLFPTKNLIKIQKRNHFRSTVSGFGYGILGGAGVGAILGTFVGDAEGGTPDGSPQWGSRNQRPTRLVIFLTSTS